MTPESPGPFVPQQIGEEYTMDPLTPVVQYM